jgi:hypothetical protein
MFAMLVVGLGQFRRTHVADNDEPVFVVNRRALLVQEILFAGWQSSRGLAHGASASVALVGWWQVTVDVLPASGRRDQAFLTVDRLAVVIAFARLPRAAWA